MITIKTLTHTMQALFVWIWLKVFTSSILASVLHNSCVESLNARYKLTYLCLRLDASVFTNVGRLCSTVMNKQCKKKNLLKLHKLKAYWFRNVYSEKGRFNIRIGAYQRSSLHTITHIGIIKLNIKTESVIWRRKTSF